MEPWTLWNSLLRKFSEKNLAGLKQDKQIMTLFWLVSHDSEIEIVQVFQVEKRTDR